MRRFLLIGFVFIFYASAFPAANFKITVHDSAGQGNPGEEVVLGGFIHNLTGDTLTIEITRTINDLPGSWSTSICLETCLAPWVSTTSGKIAPNDSVEFSLHFLTDATPATGKAALSFNEFRRTEFETVNFSATTISNGVSQLPATATDFQLRGNYPNPFNGTTMIRFFVNQKVRSGKIQIYSILGQLIFETQLPQIIRGENEFRYSAVDFDGHPLSSGVYIYQISLFPEKGAPITAINRLTFMK